jgi:isopentenyl-diphosphate delta-isomerase
MKNNVILVDETDKEIGVMEKLLAHKKGLLHRAVSVFVFNTDGRFLLQKRAMNKYHSGGLWSNTACSHPFPSESVAQAATRRLKEEMGLELNLKPAFGFTYKVVFSNGLIEHEFDHVFVGVSDVLPKPNEKEVMAWAYWSEKEIEYRLNEDPNAFTEWFKLIYKEVLKKHIRI